ncbi:MAG: type II secretion system secretin GspD [Gammaproteobacteria bacterium]|nr:type II secretion system secretin GspD [Gammaproteobacteria bacterium]
MKSWIQAVAILLLLNSCGTTTTGLSEEPHQRLVSADGESSDEPIFSTTVNASDAGGVEDVELKMGNGSFINEQAAQRKLSAVSEDGEIVLNFEGESLQSVVHTILGEVLQETFVIGPGVSGQVTFSTSKPVSRDQLMPILELLLRWNGAAMVFTEGRYHILPVADAIRGNLVPTLSDEDLAMGYEVRVVPLEFIGAQEMATILEPYVRDGAIVRVDIPRNMLFLAGTQEELRNYQQTVEVFDVDWLAGMSVGIYPLETVDVDSITTELTTIFGTDSESPLAGMFRFVPLERLGSVMVITPKQEYLEKARTWIETLDRGAAGSGVQLYVYRVKNLEAQVLADYLTQLFGGTTSAPRQDRSRGTLAPGLQEAQSSSISNFNSNRQAANQRGAQQSNRNTGGLVSPEEGEIRITSVIETNSLLIQASQTQYSSIQAAIERIDEEPLQVLIESQIMDVKLNEALEFGVNWYLTNDATATDGDSGNLLSEGIKSLTAGSDTNFFASITGGLGSNFMKATISALDSVTDVRSLGAPSLLVRNNATATITVGTQVPVQSSSISTGNSNVVSSAQYVSTGVTLTVTPRINPGGLVYMDVTQEVSSADQLDPKISSSGNPPISNKSVTSQVAVQSGQTIFLGGLITEQSSKSRTGVPYLNRIPGIGRLFGSQKSHANRSETIVMITPTVIESITDLKMVSEDIRNEFIRIAPIKHATLHSEE